jgi:hypothetical protein
MEFEEEVVLLVLMQKQVKRRKGSINSGYISY